MFHRTIRFLSFLVLCFLWTLVVGCSSNECKNDENCPRGEVCSAGQCLSKASKRETTSITDSGVSRQCPTYCSSDRDCSFCENRLSCDLASNTCIDARAQCPSPCASDQDCSLPICGARQFCDPSTKTCVETIARCPDKCKQDKDCSAGGCGERKACNVFSGRCVLPRDARCDPACKDDSGCKECSGGRVRCSKTWPSSNAGVCRANPQGTCPSSCTRTSQCFVSGCGNKLFCNFLLRKCTNAADACPRSCKSDKDCPVGKCGSYTRCANGRCTDACPRSCKTNNGCAKSCGERTLCYRYNPKVDGFCRKPPTAKQCPDTCTTSYDCKASECGKNAYCNVSTKKCASAENLCPDRCDKDDDCPASKCGVRISCKAGICQRR